MKRPTFLRVNRFTKKMQAKMADITFKEIAPEVLKHVNINQKYLKYGNSIRKIRNYHFNKKKVAIVVGAGPSLKKNNQIQTIKKYANKAIIVACDGSLYYLLRNNILPDVTVTLDPDDHRMIRWFGDKTLSKKKLLKDDYFRRQDLDHGFKDEMRANKNIIKLFDRFAKKLNIAICTSASELVVKRLVKGKAKLFWWNPLLDNPNKKKSLSRKIFNKNKLPLINAIGNVGSAAWMIASGVLCCDKIALIGMDYSYYIDTPFKQTQYYDVIRDRVGTKYLKFFYKKIFNPKIKKYFYTDHAYLWYRNCFLEMIRKANSKTTNCSGAGILFGKKLGWTTLSNFCRINLD